MATKRFYLSAILIVLSLVIGKDVFAGPPPFCYQEEDGSPTGCFKKIKFANGTLTDNGDGTYSHSQAGAGGGDVTDVGTCSSGGCLIDGTNHVLTFEGTTADTIESKLGATDPTVGDQTFNLPDMASGGTYTIATTSSNVATATALAANGANCSAGEYPLGVTASGAVESCTDATTEIAAYSQPLEATLTDIADGTIAEDLVNTANPWADNEVADTITASNYLPLAGGTMTGELKLAAQGLEGTATDTLTDCSTFSATGGGIFYDDSEGKWKKCQDNVLSDMDTTGAGATITVEEDNATVDAAVTNLDFLGADFDVTSSPAGEANVVSAAAITRDTEWDTESEVQTAWGSANILLETEIDASSELLALMDDETGTGLLTFATNPLFTAARFGNAATTGGYFDIVEDTDNGTNRIRFTAPSAITSDQECVLENDGNPIPDSCVGDGTDAGGASGAKIIQLNPYSGKLSGAYVTATITSVTTATQGAQIDAGDGNWRILFDATTDEAAVFYGIVPDNYTSTPVIKLIYSMVSGTANEVEWEGAVMCVTPGDAADVGTASFAAGAASVETVPATAGHTDTLVSITPTDDSCAAGDLIYVWVSTDGADATNDDATGDRELVGAYVAYT